jgi:hypothetical protein
VWQGGYPAIHHRGVPADRWLGAYVRTYVERDVRQHLAVADLAAVQGFLELAASQTGNLVCSSARHRFPYLSIPEARGRKCGTRCLL